MTVLRLAEDPKSGLGKYRRRLLDLINCGQMQADAPSVFRLGVHHGVHHVGIRTTDIVADEAKLAAAGMKRIQRGVSASGSITVFMDGGRDYGIIELIQSADGGAFAKKVRTASETWNRVSLYVI